MEILWLIGISQGVFLSLMLLFVVKANRPANIVLAFILAMSCIMLIGRYLYLSHYTNPLLYRLATCVDVIVFLIGPAMYTYVRRLAFHESSTFKLSWPHYIPAFLHSIFVLSTFRFGFETYQKLSQSGAFGVYYLCIELMGIVTNLYFLMMSFKLLRRYRHLEEKRLSFRQHLPTYLRWFLVAYTICILAWILSFVSAYFFQTFYRYIHYEVVWNSIPVLIYVIGFYSFSQPALFRLPILENSQLDKGPSPVADTNTERLDPIRIKKLQTTLEQLMQEERVYLNNQLTLTDLANLMNTSKNNVSWLLNNIHKQSFYQYINKYRIHEFIKRIEAGEHHKHTIQAISLDVGFNSKSTFNKVFKSTLHTTPSSYIKQKETG